MLELKIQKEKSETVPRELYEATLNTRIKDWTENWQRSFMKNVVKFLICYIIQSVVNREKRYLIVCTRKQLNSQDEYKYVRKKALRIRNFRQFENVVIFFEY